MVMIIGDENAARWPWVHMEVHYCWGPRVQRLMLPPLLVPHKERGEPLHRLAGRLIIFHMCGGHDQRETTAASPWLHALALTARTSNLRSHRSRADAV
jgi:hypothetical protein